mgnify:CR=1 FL=1
MQSLTVLNTQTELATLNNGNQLSDTAKALITKSKADGTTVLYKKHISYFCDWCKKEGVNFAVTYSNDKISIDGLESLSSIDVANYVSHLVSDGKKISTIIIALAAINNLTTPFGYTPAKGYDVKLVLDGAKRTIGVAKKKAKAIRSKQIVFNLNAINEIYPNTAQRLRNTALLLLGFSGAFRRSELVALKVSDLVQNEKGLLVTIRKSKTDQFGEGKQKPIPTSKTKETCPVAALMQWITFAGLKGEDFIFASIHKSGIIQPKPLAGKDVSLIVKRVLGKEFSAHGLRGGFITEAFEKGFDVKIIQQTTGQITDAVTNSYYQSKKQMDAAIDIW